MQYSIHVRHLGTGHNRDISHTVLTNTVNLEFTDSRRLGPKRTIVLNFKVTATISWILVVVTEFRIVKTILVGSDNIPGYILLRQYLFICVRLFKISNFKVRNFVRPSLSSLSFAFLAKKGVFLRRIRS